MYVNIILIPFFSLHVCYFHARKPRKKTHSLLSPKARTKTQQTKKANWNEMNIHKFVNKNKNETGNIEIYHMYQVYVYV